MGRVPGRSVTSDEHKVSVERVSLRSNFWRVDVGELRHRWKAGWAK